MLLSCGPILAAQGRTGGEDVYHNGQGPKCGAERLELFYIQERVRVEGDLQIQNHAGDGCVAHDE